MGKCLLSVNAKDGKTTGFCIIKSIEIKKSQAGSQYLDLSMGDKYGEIRSKLWDYKPDQHGTFHTGDIVKVRGRITTWQNNDQFNVDQIRMVNENDEFDMSELVPSAPVESQKMYDDLVTLAESFKDEDYRKISCFFLEKYKQNLLIYPAALKLHHAMRGGLLYHTTSLVELAKHVCEVYPELDRELLLCGTMLHDIAKIQEYELASSGLAGAYTARGQLVGHLVMGASWIFEAGRELNIDDSKSMLLEHMLISHHGEPEFGAAKYPMFPEAEVLSEVDMLDARLNNMFTELDAVAPGEFTQPVWSLDHRRLYKKTN